LDFAFRKVSEGNEQGAHSEALTDASNSRRIVKPRWGRKDKHQNDQIQDGDPRWISKMKIQDRDPRWRFKIGIPDGDQLECISPRWIGTIRVRELYHHWFVEYSVLLEDQKFFNGEESSRWT
jgi:hypothetical protein